MFNEIQITFKNIIEEFHKSILDSGESLSPKEFTAISNKMLTEAYDIGKEKIQSILDIQLFLSDVKDCIKINATILNPALEIINGRSKRLIEVKVIISEALEKKFKFNDSKLNVIIIVINT